MTRSKFVLFISALFFAIGASDGIEKPLRSTPTLSLKIELTSVEQKILADSLLEWLAGRLQVFSNEYKRFALSNSQDSADVVLRLQILGLNIITSDSLSVLAKNRAKLQKQMDEELDSAESRLPGQIAAANITANIVANMISMPFGFATVLVVTGKTDRSEAEAEIIESTTPTAWVRYKAELNQKTKILWKRNKIVKYEFNYTVSEQEQIHLLMRNIILDLEDKIPVLKPNWKLK